MNYADQNEIIYIVEGRVTCTDAHPGAQIGDVEWQFSDGPPGERGNSADYVDLEAGLREMSARLPGARFVFIPL